MTLSQLGLVNPNFWLAILLILLVAVYLEWLEQVVAKVGARL